MGMSVPFFGPLPKCRGYRRVSEGCPPELCGSHVPLWWNFQWNLKEESIGPRAVLGLLCPTGMGLWVLDTGLDWTKYLSGAGTCLDSRPTWVLSWANLDTELSAGSLYHSPPDYSGDLNRLDED